MKEILETLKWADYPEHGYRLAYQTDDTRDLWFKARVYFDEEGITSFKSPAGRWVFKQGIPPNRYRTPIPPIPGLPKLTRPEGLRAYQIDPCRNTVAALREFGAHLNASDMGTGKTYVSLAAFRELGISPVVVAPATLLVAWQRAAEALGMQCRPVSYERLNRVTEFGRWEGTKKFLRYRWRDDVRGIIFDEAHRCKGTGTKAQKAMTAAARSNAVVDALTATGAESPMELKALGVLLGLHDGRNFYEWAQRYGCLEGLHGGFEFSGYPGLMERIHKQIFPAKACRVRKEELGDAFPETEFILRTIRLPERSEKAIGKLYADLEEAVGALYEKAEDYKAPGSALSRINLLFQEIELLKAPALVEMVQDLVGEGYSVPVFTRFNATIDLVSKGLRNTPHGIYRGATSFTEKARRQEVLDSFQNDTIRSLLTNYAAGSTGVGMHDLNGRFPRAPLHSLHYNSRLVKQAFGRVQRDGGKSRSTQIIVGAAGTVEELILARIAGKIRNMDLLNDGDLLPESFSAKLLQLLKSRETAQVAEAVA